MYNKVEICGVDTTRLPILSEKEKHRLLLASRAGDKQARRQMVEGNLRLVLSVVQRFQDRGQSADDLFQVGCIGLIKAIDNFDPAMNVRFSTYGVPMIIGEIRRFLRDNTAMRVSRSLRDTACRAMQTREQLEKSLGREPSITEISRAMGTPRRTVALALEAAADPVSLYEPTCGDGDDALYVLDQLGDKDGESNWIDTMLLRDAVSQLTERERRILSMRYFAGKTQSEVARQVGISQAQVSRLEKSAMQHIHDTAF